MPAVIGVLAALVERQTSSRGQVIDAAIVNGAAQLTQVVWSMRADGRWSDDRGTNVFDGSAPFYRTYECADGAYVAVGALEAEFFAKMLAVLDIDPETVGPQRDESGWPAMHALLSDNVRAADAGRMECAFREHRRVRDTGIDPGGGGRRPAPNGAGRVHRDRRRDATCAGTPVLQDSPAPAIGAAPARRSSGRCLD